MGDNTRDKSLHGLLVALGITGTIAGMVIVFAYGASDTGLSDQGPIASETTNNPVIKTPSIPATSDEPVVEADVSIPVQAVDNNTSLAIEAIFSNLTSTALSPVVKELHDEELQPELEPEIAPIAISEEPEDEASTPSIEENESNHKEESESDKDDSEGPKKGKKHESREEPRNNKEHGKNGKGHR